MLEKMAQFPFSSGLANMVWLEPITLLTAFWLGFMANATIVWGYKGKFGKEMGMVIPAIATSGLVLALLLLVTKLSVFNVCWSVVLVIIGWMMVSSTKRMVTKEKKVKVN